MKNFITFFLAVFIMMPSSAEIITGGIEYNTNSARAELLNTKRPDVSAELLKSNITDSNFSENTNFLLKGITDLQDRTLGLFSDKSYAVIYKDNPTYVWYYNPSGVLTHSEVKTGLEYPCKTFKYTPDNRLVNMSLRVSKQETFIYNPNGKLIAHWLYNNCYDENNNIIMTRKIFE